MHIQVWRQNILCCAPTGVSGSTGATSSNRSVAQSETNTCFGALPPLTCSNTKCGSGLETQAVLSFTKKKLEDEQESFFGVNMEENLTTF